MTRLKFIIPLMLVICAGSYSASAPAETIAEILARNKTVDLPPPPKVFPYIYTANFALEQIEGKEAQSFEARYKVNPNAVAGSRVEVISASDETYHAEFQAHIDALESEDLTAEKAAEDLWCDNDKDDDENEANLAALFETNPPEIISEDERRAVLRLPVKDIADSLNFDISLGDDVSDDDKNTANKTAEKFLKRMQAELVLDKPEGRMRQLRMWLPKPMRVMLVAKIKKMDFNFVCEPSPAGHLYRARQNIEMQVSALGQKVTNKQVNEIISLGE